MIQLLSEMQNNNAINVEISINSGQVFLWRKNGEYWDGVNGQDVLRIDNSGSIESYQNIKTDFFRKKDNIDEILKSISKDNTTRKAVEKYHGLRILNQDPFQCLISFIVSSNSNIQKIKGNPKVWAIHGDSESCDMFAKEIHEKFGLETYAPAVNDTITV